MLTEVVEGRAIRVIRERKGLTVKEVLAGLAELGVQVSLPAFYHYENGRYQPSAKKIVALARVLDCEPDRFFAAKQDAA